MDGGEAVCAKENQNTPPVMVAQMKNVFMATRQFISLLAARDRPDKIGASGRLD